MKMSQEISELAKAMCSAQKVMKPATKDSTNPHFRSRYADFASMWEAAQEAYTSNGLMVAQDVTSEKGDGYVSVITRVVHSSGQWMEFGPFIVPASKVDAQGLGSASTYAKRYSLSSALMIVSSDDVDDDGEMAVGRSVPREVSNAPRVATPNQIKFLSDLMNKTEPAKRAAVVEKYQVSDLNKVTPETASKIIEELK